MGPRYLLLLAFFFTLCINLSHGSHGSSPFIFYQPQEMVKTEAGSLRVLPSSTQGLRLGVSWNILTLEPKALLIPQYIDATALIYVQQGNLTLGLLSKGHRFSKHNLKAGDIYVISRGSVFYMLNRDKSQRLRLFGIVDASQTGQYQPFYVAGGMHHPRTVLAGFPASTLAAAFKVSKEEIASLLGARDRGPIIFTTKQQYDNLLAINVEAKDEEVKPFNVLKKSPNYENDNGWSIEVTYNDFGPLKEIDMGVFAVYLKAGAMLAPHWNSQSMEIAMVTNGDGYIQIAFPNGSNAINQRVRTGDGFFIPRNFPMCQMASREGVFEFVGFTTRSEPSHPLFLAGSNSIFNDLDEEILALSFDASKEAIKHVFKNQTDAVILSGPLEEEEEHPYVF